MCCTLVLRRMLVVGLGQQLLQLAMPHGALLLLALPDAEAVAVTFSSL